jgi:hypothetical protein
MTTRKPKADQQMCVVSVGFQDFLLSPEQGMQLVKLMQHAVHCEREYLTSSPTFQRGERPRLEMQIINQSAIVETAK